MMQYVIEVPHRGKWLRVNGVYGSHGQAEKYAKWCYRPGSRWRIVEVTTHTN